MRAFPTDEYYDEKKIGQHEGMTLRDFFAANVVSGYHATMRYGAADEEWPTPEAIACYAYRVADCMVEQRKIDSHKGENQGRRRSE